MMIMVTMMAYDERYPKKNLANQISMQSLRVVGSASNYGAAFF